MKNDDKWDGELKHFSVSVLSSARKNLTPKICVLFCHPNKQRSFKPFICLNLDANILFFIFYFLNYRRVKLAVSPRKAREGYASQPLNLLNNNLYNHFQSANRADHSAEKALLDILNCLLGSADEGQESVLTLLDLSAASIWTIAFSSHGCTTCLACLARLSNGFPRTSLIESRL